MERRIWASTKLCCIVGRMFSDSWVLTKVDYRRVGVDQGSWFPVGTSHAGTDENHGIEPAASSTRKLGDGGSVVRGSSKDRVGAESFA